jgi:hypothetical protein
MGAAGRSARSKGKGKARDDGSAGETRIEMSGLPPIWFVPPGLRASLGPAPRAAPAESAQLTLDAPPRVDISDEVTTLLDQVRTKSKASVLGLREC